jgi:thioester reductase-like protein
MNTTAQGNNGLLVTGATGFIGFRLLKALAEQHRRLLAMCRPASIPRLTRRLATFGDQAGRIQILPGDLDQPDLGLDPAARQNLGRQVSEIFHLAAGYHLGMSEQAAMQTNLEGTRRMLKLASGLPRLRRFHQVSSIAVSGNFDGRFHERDLDVGQEFDHAYGRSKFLSEGEVRRSGLPFTIYRPGVVVGDSRSGEIDKVDGPYYLFRVLSRARKIPGATRSPLLGMREADRFLPVVPVDYVVAAACRLAGLPASLGKTYHLLDPDPPSFASFYEASLRAFGFSGPILRRPLDRTFKLLKLPGVRQSFKWISEHLLQMPPEASLHAQYRVTYDQYNTSSDLAGSNISCPPLSTYLPTLVDYFERHLAQ